MSALGRFRSLWRLRAYLRPYRARMAVMLTCAGLGVGSITIVPLVLRAIVDGPIRHGRRGQLVPMCLLVLALGLAEAAFIYCRRVVQQGVVLRVERQIRDDLYSHLQRLPVAFHDRWQTGQLISRATTDLGTIRRFVGFGAIFLVVNALMVATVIALLITINWPLGLIVAVMMVPIGWLGKRF